MEEEEFKSSLKNKSKSFITTLIGPNEAFMYLNMS
jgi:hypothetical protein